MAQRIYVADNEKSTRNRIATYLKTEGFEAETFADASTLLAACKKARPNLVILNADLPEIDGLSACARLRRNDSALGIILISATDNPYERVTGFSFGCDDYMVIPFLPLELIARVRAVLRRGQCGAGGETTETQKFTYGSMTLFPGQRTAYVDGRKLTLTPAEFDFLAYLIDHAETAVSRKELLKNLWQSDWQADTRATDDLVKRLRRKLKEINSSVYIETVWGYGFRLAMSETA